MEKSIFECPICLETPSLPVATQCGHIFCWKCIKSWTYGQTMLVCPVCKNGLDMNKVISLYTSSSQFNAEKDERPKTDRIDPVRNQEGPSFVWII